MLPTSPPLHTLSKFIFTSKWRGREERMRERREGERGEREEGERESKGFTGKATNICPLALWLLA